MGRNSRDTSLSRNSRDTSPSRNSRDASSSGDQNMEESSRNSSRQSRRSSFSGTAHVPRETQSPVMQSAMDAAGMAMLGVEAPNTTFQRPGESKMQAAKRAMAEANAIGTTYWNPQDTINRVTSMDFTVTSGQLLADLWHGPPEVGPGSPLDNDVPQIGRDTPSQRSDSQEGHQASTSDEGRSRAKQADPSQTQQGERAPESSPIVPIDVTPQQEARAGADPSTLASDNRAYDEEAFGTPPEVQKIQKSDITSVLNNAVYKDIGPALVALRDMIPRLRASTYVTNSDTFVNKWHELVDSNDDKMKRALENIMVRTRSRLSTQTM